VGAFIEECCIEGDEYKATAKDLYEAFEDWWEANISQRVPKQKPFGKWMGERFEKKKKGTVWYYGVGLLSDLSDSADPGPDHPDDQGQMFKD